MSICHFVNLAYKKRDKCSKIDVCFYDFTRISFVIINSSNGIPFLISYCNWQYYFLEYNKAALIKSTNKGCGFNTVLLYSG